VTGAQLSTVQRAKAGLHFGSHVKLTASVRVSSIGIVAIGILVSSVLLSTAVLVSAAKR
jgi:hypothetical protein